MSRRFLALVLATAASLATATPADALQFGSSSTTGKSTVLVPLRTGGTLAGPIAYSLGMRIAPSLSDMLGPANVSPGATEAASMLFDADFALSYRHVLADVNFLGRFNPTIAPFLGYRYLGALTLDAPSLSNVSATASTANLHGLHYGIGADTELPLGLRGYAHAGMTTLMGGGWDQRRNGFDVTGSGKIDPAGASLPLFGLGASWSLGPILHLSVGYDLFMLPTAMRSQAATLGAGRTTINNLTVGINLGGISF